MGWKWCSLSIQGFCLEKVLSASRGSYAKVKGFSLDQETDDKTEKTEDGTEDFNDEDLDESM